MTIQFGAGQVIAVPTLDAAGNTIANPTPIQIALLQDISVDVDFETKTLYGEKQFPVAIGRGKAKIGWKAKAGDFNGALLGGLVLGADPVATRKAAVIDDPFVVPATLFQITIAPPSTGTFVLNMGVKNVLTGKPLTRVASAPATGQYTVTAGGVYTFAAADVGLALLISYEYTIATSAGSALYSITNNLMGYTPTFVVILQNKYAGSTQTMKLNANVLGKLSLPYKNDDFTMVDIDAQAFSDTSGSVGYICQY